MSRDPDPTVVEVLDALDSDLETISLNLDDILDAIKAQNAILERIAEAIEAMSITVRMEKP